MEYYEALDKVRKLLRLSESSNPHEAALAASRAQEIIDRFKIEKIALEYEGGKAEPEEEIKDFGFDPIDKEQSRRVEWKMRLASHVARNNQCKAYSSGGEVCLIGRPTDVNTVRYIYSWLVREVERLARRDCAGCGRSYANNYRLGVVDTIGNRLYEERKKTFANVRAEAEQVSERALAVVNNSLTVLDRKMSDVVAWTKQNVKLRTVRSNASFHPGAREAGRVAGHEINLNPARGRISPGFGGHLK